MVGHSNAVRQSEKWLKRRAAEYGDLSSGEILARAVEEALENDEDLNFMRKILMEGLLISGLHGDALDVARLEEATGNN